MVDLMQAGNGQSETGYGQQLGVTPSGGKYDESIRQQKSDEAAAKRALKNQERFLMSYGQL